MSDLSNPPTSLLPAHADGRHDLFAWPTPPLSCYPSPAAAKELERCEVEGLNGRIMPGKLAQFLPQEDAVQLLTPNMRVPVTVRFAQFRRITLVQPLAPATAPKHGSASHPLDDRPALPYRLELSDGQVQEGTSIGAEEQPYGIFLFEPVDALGSVRRSFVPRAVIKRFDLGRRLGELLVEQRSATREQVEQVAELQQSLRSQKLGEVLLVRQVVKREDLEQALEEQSRMPMVRIGEALLAMGFISPPQLDAALEQQAAERGTPLGELLVQRGVVTRQDLQLALSRKMGYPVVDLKQFPADADALARVPYSVASRQAVLPLMLRSGRLVVALDDPGRRTALDEIEFVTQMKLVPVLGDAQEIPAAVERAYDRLGIGAWLPSEEMSFNIDPAAQKDVQDARGLLATMEMQEVREAALETEDAQIAQSDNSLVKLINKMIGEAQTQGVSDIHVETQPGREKVRVRFRKDGVLHHYLELPHTYRAALIARLKIMCDLDISEKRKPQDGKIAFGRFQTGSKLELRLATIPTNNGLEDAVLRLLASAKPLPLGQMQFSDDNLKRLQRAMQRPYGLVLCVGPTGSGKTTTLHSAMASINTPDRKIWTAEDPIEITQAGLRQVQVNPKIDWTFAKALRAFLRADPDVIMVGEIRDQETAQTAIEASLTGHLVLSTLHTNSAAETVTRLLDMGMDPFNFADSLLAVVAQRLARRLCNECAKPRALTTDELDELAGDWLHSWGDAEGRPTSESLVESWRARHSKDGQIFVRHADGCPACDHAGFRGRIGLHEVMEVTREIRRLIQTGARAEEIARTAVASGMRTLRQDGIEKVLAGQTTIEEVRASANA